MGVWRYVYPKHTSTRFNVRYDTACGNVQRQETQKRPVVAVCALIQHQIVARRALTKEPLVPKIGHQKGRSKCTQPTRVKSRKTVSARASATRLERPHMSVQVIPRVESQTHSDTQDGIPNLFDRVPERPGHTSTQVHSSVHLRRVLDANSVTWRVRPLLAHGARNV